MTRRRSLSATTGAALLLLAVWAGAARATLPTAPPVPPDTVRGDIGDVVLTDLQGRLITSGDGSTEFFVRLPEGATCPGDSANDQWRIDSFLLPADEDPMSMEYTATGPEPPWTAGRYPLFGSADGLPLSAQFLKRNTVTGAPGEILSIPLTSFTMVAQNQFPGGEYTLGMICTYFNQPALYWDAGITISAAPADADPTKLTWTLHPPEGGDAAIDAAGVEEGGTNWPLITALVAALAAASAWSLWPRRATSKKTSKETR